MSQAESRIDGRDVRLAALGFDTELEATAFRLLAELDIEGARAAFGRLAEGLELDDVGSRGRSAVALMLDVLLNVNRRLHRDGPRDSDYQRQRTDLVEEFVAYTSVLDARRAFLPALNRLLHPLAAPAPGPHPLVAKASALIEEGYQKRISRSTVASRLNVSPNYLSRLFRREAGMTLTAFVQRTRLEHARLLLAAGERSISEVAYLVGYQNYRDFYRNFVKYENVSPRQVRRRRGSERGRQQVVGGEAP